MSEWEYKAVPLPSARDRTEGVFNELGKEGWELVSVVEIADGDFFQPGFSTAYLPYLALFKKQTTI